MKNLLKLILAIGFAVSPVWYAIHLLFFRLAPYIISVIPSGQWHALLGVAVYIAIALFGGIEIVAIVFMISLSLAGLILSTLE